MAKVFNSIEKELVNYMHIKKNQLYGNSINRIFHLKDIIILNKNLKIILTIEFDINQLNEHWVILIPIDTSRQKYHFYNIHYYDILIVKILSNKVNSVHLCDFDKYDEYDFDLNNLRIKKQNVSDLMEYIGIQLGLDYSEIQNFEKKLKLYNLSII